MSTVTQKVDSVFRTRSLGTAASGGNGSIIKNANYLYFFMDIVFQCFLTFESNVSLGEWSHISTKFSSHFKQNAFIVLTMSSQVSLTSIPTARPPRCGSSTSGNPQSAPLATRSSWGISLGKATAPQCWTQHVERGNEPFMRAILLCKGECVQI